MDINIRTTEHNGETYYCCGDIGKKLQHKNIRNLVHVIPQEHKIFKKTCTKGGNQDLSYLSKTGIIILLGKTKKSNSIALCEELGINIINHKIECIESETIGAIKLAFKGETMLEQFTVLTYHIDLYFPYYNIAIECDERGHNDRDVEYEKSRQDRITKKINCQWVRFNPDEEDFNIFNVINQIFLIIKTKTINS